MDSTPSTFQLVFGSILLIYVIALYWVGYRAAKNVSSLDDFMLAGRQLPLSISTLTLVATWFGAESLMTVANEVSESGIRKAMLDPFGIALCLWIAGGWIAGPLWRMNVMTIGDFFRNRYGSVAELVASWILVPSYFGWIAAQLVALATLLHTIFGLPVPWGIVAVAIVGSGYCMMGGMWSVSWTDAVQMLFILIGLVTLSVAVLWELGGHSLLAGTERLWSDAPTAHWSLWSQGSIGTDLSTAIAALAIGSLGNIPMQDLLQRIMSSNNERTARLSCWLAGFGYLLLGTAPIVIGIGSSILYPGLRNSGEDVVTSVASRLLSPFAMTLFLLAAVSAILSTFSSAVLSPAAVIARNMISPIHRWLTGSELNEVQSMRLQRLCVMFVVLGSVLLGMAGESAYELVLNSYAIGMVCLTAPFVTGLYLKTKSNSAPAVAAMIVGLVVWGSHQVAGWDLFFEPWLGNRFPVAQELMATVLSFAALGIAVRFGSINRTPNHFEGK